MMMKWRWSSVAAGVLFVAAGALLWTQFVNALFVAPSVALRATEGKPPLAQRAPAGEPETPVVSTSRTALDDTIERMRRRVAADPADGGSAVRLADALMRAARVRSDAALPLEAERVLKATIQHGRDYAARRMLAAVYLSQHRFADALDVAKKAQAERPQDAWNYATAGDALLELGRYEEAFDMFDQAITRRPDAGVYARVAYAKELQGDLGGAVAVMKLAAEATAPQDVEATAWVRTQLGLLHLQRRELDEARREFAHAEFLFPGHPYPLTGQVRLAVERGDYQAALQILERLPETPESLAMRGDLLAALGHSSRADAVYVEAERLERAGWASEQPQPGALARFLAARDRNVAEAVRLAERAAAERQDVHTMDALAWAYFKAGRTADASAAIRRALRTGTVDAHIRCHAAVIAEAVRSGTAGNCSPLRPA
jgi:tetratricopeptide (TPR) repeat protein